KLRPSDAVGRSARGIVDLLNRSVRVDGAAEVARAELRVRHVEEREEALRAAEAFERSEEEHVVAADRSAQRGAVGVGLQRQLAGNGAGAEVLRRRVQLVAVVELETRSAEVV